MNAPDRPALRWHGGKWMLAPWIIQHFPPHRTYTEVYGGAASVLLRTVRYHAYSHEMSTDDHAEMLEAAKGLVGAVVISGYPAALYDDALRGWARTERAALADGARERTEVLWMNERCHSALERHRSGYGSPLFAEAAE